jgi:hypothetical protein
MTPLEFYKIILEKVSFDPALFRKEYEKATQNLSFTERLLLKQWCKNNFSYQMNFLLAH